MSDPFATAQKLLTLAVDKGASSEESRTAALQFARLVHSQGLLSEPLPPGFTGARPRDGASWMERMMTLEGREQCLLRSIQQLGETHRYIVSWTDRIDQLEAFIREAGLQVPEPMVPLPQPQPPEPPKRRPRRKAGKP